MLIQSESFATDLFNNLNGMYFNGLRLFPTLEAFLLWKLNPRDRTITLTKLLIKDAKFTPKVTKIGA